MSRQHKLYAHRKNFNRLGRIVKTASCCSRTMTGVLMVCKAIFFAGLISLTMVGQSQAVVEVTPFASDEQEIRYKDLIAELRCPKCQNQNLLDSDAPIAADLRRKTRSLIDQGKSDGEIKNYMLERYGDFVLYKPRFTAATAFLWLGPFVLLLVVIVILLMRIKRKQEAQMLKPSHSEDEAVRIKVRNLMSNTPALDSQINDIKATDNDR